MTKVLYLGPEESFTTATADGEGEQQIGQGETGDVSAETLAQLKANHPLEFWFGDEPEPQARLQGYGQEAEHVMPSESARQEMIESGARAVGASVDEATRQRTIGPNEREVRVSHVVQAEEGQPEKTVPEKSGEEHPRSGTRRS